jgi:DNA polymerase-3 subunit alpha
LRWVDNGVKPVYRLTLRSGAWVKMTTDHRLLTDEGWRPLCDLRVGDFIATPPYLFGPAEISAPTVDRSKLRLLAYLIADGSLTSGATSDFVSKDPALLEEYQRRLESFDNVRPVFVPQIHGVTRISVAKRNADDYHSPNSVLAWLRDLGLKLPAGSRLGGLSSQGKYVPAFVFELGRDDIAFFLASLWDCDGYMGQRFCHYRTISRRLAEDVRTLLLRLGVHSTIYGSKYSVNRALEDGARTRVAYQVTVFDTARLADLLRFHLVSEKRFVDCAGREHPTIARAPFLAEVKSASSLSGRALMARYGIDRQHFAPVGRKRDRIAAHVVTPLAQGLDLPQTRRQLNVLWEEIVSIEVAGDERVYDLTVEGIHSFIANNIIVHNCVYQEQIMQLAQNLAGYTLGEADLMRRAMGKKKKEEMAKHEEKFIGGAISRGIQEDKARKIFTLMAQFADYGFNRCLTGDSRIVDADTGAQVTLSQLADCEVETSRTFSFDGSQIIVNEIIEAFETGEKEVVEIETEDGRTLRCTLDHKFYTDQGFLPLSEVLEKGLDIYFSTGVDAYAAKSLEQETHAGD